MKKSLLVLSFLVSMVAAQAAIIPVTDTSTNLDLSFDLRDNLLTPGGVTEVYTNTAFPGTSITFYFRDRLF